MKLLKHDHFYLVGIKGVAMAALVQCLVDAKKHVQGCDVAEEFVTDHLLRANNIQPDIGFELQLPSETEVVIYTSAHQGPHNPLVQQAQKRGILVLSHAEALAELFNHKDGIAVCGVGGKSTTSAMIAWILEKTKQQPSFAVGVGDILGLGRTGRWSDDSKVFVAEADEYVTDPSAPSRGQTITPRFSYMKPFVTVCTNLKFDHPDVYRDFEHTKETYLAFFEHIKQGGSLVVNADDDELFAVSNQLSHEQDISLLTYGQHPKAHLRLVEYTAQTGQTRATVEFAGKKHTLTLQIPGIFNVMNALAALAACFAIGTPLPKSCDALSSFQSTKRRSEFVGEKNGILYYDDYAHHPTEVAHIIAAFKEWYPDKKLIVGFQSHTFSRTRALFEEFTDAFNQADRVVMIDIFPSAREAFDPDMSSDILCQAISEKHPSMECKNLGTVESLAQYLKTEVPTGAVVLTVGAGDIYKVHDLV